MYRMFLGLLSGLVTTGDSALQQPDTDLQTLPEYVSPDIYTSPTNVEAMPRPAGVNGDDVVYDLGRGDGRPVYWPGSVFSLDQFQEDLLVHRQVSHRSFEPSVLNIWGQSKN